MHMHVSDYERERERVNPLFPKDERNFITINKNIYHKLSNTKLHFQEMDYSTTRRKRGEKNTNKLYIEIRLLL